MFTKNTYLVPQASASLHPRASSTTVDHSGFDEFLLHHHHYPDMYTGHYLGGNAAVVDHDDLFNQEFLGLNGDPDDSLENAPQAQQPMAKKDRHSKIFTAQGPRDRRVRLSKGIARKFFDLQEMLGFDKPSKTLDWLLTKSRTAISELLQTKQKGSSSSLSECDQVLSSAGNGDSCFENGNCCSEDSRQMFVHGAKDSEQQTDSSKLAKESRAKARERARARTREKMCIKQLNESRENIQFGNNNQFEVFQLSAGSCSFKENAGIGAPGANRPVVNVTATEDLIQEPVERCSYHRQSLGGSRDSMIVSNYNAGPSVNATENWDIWNQSYLYAVWDQHKFINSSSCNM